MLKLCPVLRFFCAPALLLFACCTFAHAQTAQRTFVSTSGNDSNTASLCGRTAPCRGFAAAISVVAAGGEVVALDSGGYGAVTITKAVQLISPSGVYAGITASASDGVTLNAPNATVVLRGLSINRQGEAANGVLVQAVGALHIEGCTINGFAEDGIDFSVAGKLFVKDSIIRNNLRGILVGTESGVVEASLDRVRLEGNSQDGLRVTDYTQVALRDSVTADNGEDGIRVSPGVFGSATALHVENCVSTDNGQHGIEINAINSGLTADVSIARSALVNNGDSGVSAFSLNTFYIITIEDSRILNNAGFGIITINSGADVRVAGTTITRNGTGIRTLTSSTVSSFGDNNLAGNRTSDGAFTSSIAKQ